MTDLSALLGAMAATPRLPGAACVGHGAVFDGETDDDIAEAMAICARCPALQQCTEWHRSLPRRHRPIGVVAGQVVAQPKPRGTAA